MITFAGIGIETTKEKPFVNITKAVEQIVKDSKIKKGLVHVFSKHTTMAIKITEDCKLAHVDCEHILDTIAPNYRFYWHDVLELRDVPPTERINGHAHVKQLFMNTSELIPIFKGKMQLGEWQQIFAVELDPARIREINVMVIGE